MKRKALIIFYYYSLEKSFPGAGLKMLSPGIGFCGGVLTHSPWTLFLFPLIVTGLKSEGNYKKGSADTSNEMCPCLPMDKCPRIYGQSAMDIRELGFLEPCHRFGTVRCCGVTVSSRLSLKFFSPPEISLCHILIDERNLN